MQTIIYDYTTILEEIKSRADITDIIGTAVDLKRKGAKYWGLCPFHGEKTPSFSVNPEKQRFHCFGCGTSGDVINFVQSYYNMDFSEAINWLAEHYGISPTTDAPSSAELRQIIHDRRQDKQNEETAQGIIKAEYSRLCALERTLHKILSTIKSESDLDRPDVIIALQNQTRLEAFLDDWLSADEGKRLELALFSRGVF